MSSFVEIQWELKKELSVQNLSNKTEILALHNKESHWLIGGLLSGDILQKSMKDLYTKPKLELHSER